MGIKFHETVFAKKLFDSQIPKIIKELGRIADALEKIAKEKENKETKGK